MKLMLKESMEVYPDVKFILMEPFFLDVGNFDKDFVTYRKDYTDRIQKDLKGIAEEFNAIYIPLQNRFEEASKIKPADYWIWDSVHPTYAGHGLIADAWVEAFKVNAKKLINSDSVK